MQRVGGSAEHTRFNLDLYNDWKQIVGKWNWYEFTFIKLHFEWTKRQGSVELHIGLLGLTAVITYVYDFTFIDEMNAMKDDIESGKIGGPKPSDEVKAMLNDMFPGMTVEDPTGALDKLDESEANKKAANDG
jgi:hypothetical protein